MELEKKNRLKRMLGKADDEELKMLFEESLEELKRRELRKALQFADDKCQK